MTTKTERAQGYVKGNLAQLTDLPCPRADEHPAEPKESMFSRTRLLRQADGTLFCRAHGTIVQ